MAGRQSRVEKSCLKEKGARETPGWREGHVYVQTADPLLLSLNTEPLHGERGPAGVQLPGCSGGGLHVTVLSDRNNSLSVSVINWEYLKCRRLRL